MMYFPIMNWRIISCILHWCRWQICPRGNITVFRIYVQVTETLLMSKTVLYNPQCISFVHDCTIWFSFPNFHINITKCVRITSMFYSSSKFFLQKIYTLHKGTNWLRSCFVSFILAFWHLTPWQKLDKIIGLHHILHGLT